MERASLTAIHAKTALLANGWARDVRFEVANGVIASVSANVAAESGDDRRQLVVPAMSNLHSHAFQRAMAGLAERRGPGDDSFWSWRTVMYDLALKMTPDQVEAIAAQLYMEMLEAGFCRVGEFHYLHNDRDGSPYANIAEMAERVAAASSETGIGLTLLPVFYAHSGFGGQAPTGGQRRFIHSLDGFARLMEAADAIVAALPGGRLGVAPHSLRAVTKDELGAVFALYPKGPVHIHIAEQVREVEDCLAFSGARPVEWLLDHAPVDGRWCLIHATHMTETEVRRMAESGAVAGLCPITEANLGDGIFSGASFFHAGGRFGVGSDSNVDISLSGELRMFEYSQRLGTRARNVIADPNGSTGRKLFELALEGGAAAMGTSVGLQAGKPADIVALDSTFVSYLSDDRLLDHWIFAGGLTVDAVWVGGEKRVEGGRHVARETIGKRFREAMAKLLGD